MGAAVERFLAGENRQTIIEKEKLLADQQKLKQDIDQVIEARRADELAKAALENETKTDENESKTDDNAEDTRIEESEVEKCEEKSNETENAEKIAAEK